jgi:hypothetical protein
MTRHIAGALIILALVLPQWRTCTCRSAGRTWPCSVRFESFGTKWLPLYYCR